MAQAYLRAKVDYQLLGLVRRHLGLEVTGYTSYDEGWREALSCAFGHADWKAIVERARNIAHERLLDTLKDIKESKASAAAAAKSADDDDDDDDAEAGTSGAQKAGKKRKPAVSKQTAAGSNTRAGASPSGARQGKLTGAKRKAAAAKAQVEDAANKIPATQTQIGKQGRKGSAKQEAAPVTGAQLSPFCTCASYDTYSL